MNPSSHATALDNKTLLAHPKTANRRMINLLASVGLGVTTVLAASGVYAAAQPDWDSIANPPPAWQKRSVVVEAVATDAQTQPAQTLQKRANSTVHLGGGAITQPYPADNRPVAVRQPMPQQYFDDWDARERQFWERETYHERVQQNNQRVIEILGDMQDQQLQRLTEGVVQGRLAKNMLVRLMNGQKALRQFERQALSDGLWTKTEYESALNQYAQLDRLLDRSLQRQQPSWPVDVYPPHR